MTTSTTDAIDLQPQTWEWQGQTITYVASGTAGPAVVLIHGFGASWGHWQKNIPVLAQHCRVYAIDLLGFGASAKPFPGQPLTYTFETWGQQIVDFCREVVGGTALLIGNSIGCIVAMQAAVQSPETIERVALLNCSLRLLHDRRRQSLPWYRNQGSRWVQNLLGIRSFGHFFFRLMATPRNVRQALLQAYGAPEAVTDELVEMLMKPSRDPGAADVFLAFTRYSQGPLPEDLLEILPCPATLFWGTADPWEPIDLGRKLADFPSVEAFIPLEGAGHCPQDEVPEQVNTELLRWITMPSSDPA